VELLGALSLAKLSGDGSDLNDLDARKPNPVARCHLSIHLLNNTIQSSVPVFLVHVVITCSALVLQPYSKVLDYDRILLKNLQSEIHNIKMLVTKMHNPKAEKHVILVLLR